MNYKKNDKMLNFMQKIGKLKYTIFTYWSENLQKVTLYGMVKGIEKQEFIIWVLVVQMCEVSMLHIMAMFNHLEKEGLAEILE